MFSQWIRCAALTENQTPSGLNNNFLKNELYHKTENPEVEQASKDGFIYFLLCVLAVSWGW